MNGLKVPILIAKRLHFFFLRKVRRSVFLSIEAAKEIISRLDTQIGDRPLGNPHFKDPDVEVFQFKREFFTPIRTIKSDRKLAFVDGGNLELLGAPNFSVQLNRIYACIWKNNERCTTTKIPQIEFYSAVYSNVIDNEIVFKTALVPTVKQFADFLPAQEDLTVKYYESEDGSWRVDASKVASMARHFSEWCFATKLAETLDPDDVIVMDGSLQTQFQNEAKYFRRIEETAHSYGVVLTSLSKTSSLFTDTGLSLLGAISKFATDSGIDGEWYHPIFRSKKHHVFGMIVKLKSDSEWVFRLDFQLNQFDQLKEAEINDILSAICANSSDPTFLGYPYGSIDSDLFSRVSKDEVDYYRALLASQISAMKKQGQFVPHIRAGDAHNLLNTIAGF
jgi:hypothetical protein